MDLPQSIHPLTLRSMRSLGNNKHISRYPRMLLLVLLPISILTATNILVMAQMTLLPLSLTESNSPATSGSHSNPYTVEALEENPHLGWQPTDVFVPSPLGKSFSWRTCAANNGSVAVAGCHEDPSELGDPPLVDENWIPDPTMVRKMLLYGRDRKGNPFPPSLSVELCGNLSPQGDTDTDRECILKTKVRSMGNLNSTTVRINATNHYGVTASESSKGVLLDVLPPRVICLVYTMAGAHADRIRAMRETWAGGCDGFLAFSTVSDPRLPAIQIEHNGKEEYNNMWQKVRSIWKFVGANYLYDYDWFYIGGDDLFVLPYNLKAYLASLAHKDGLDPKITECFVGQRFNWVKPDWVKKIDPLARTPGTEIHDYFNAGGPGYALSQAALRKFIANIDDTQHCHANDRTSKEDVMMARCLRHLGVNLTDTRDLEGRERFHNFSPGTLLHLKPDGENKWFFNYTSEWGLKTGEDCCAPDSVSFHYIKRASQVRHMHALLNFCAL